jgi:hypothetical protein
LPSFLVQADGAPCLFLQLLDAFFCIFIFLLSLIGLRRELRQGRSLYGRALHGGTVTISLRRPSPKTASIKPHF